MVNEICFNWLSLGPLKGITEVYITGLFHPIAWDPTDSNVTGKTLWQKAKEANYAKKKKKKELTEQRLLALERPASAGPQLASEKWTGNQFPTLTKIFPDKGGSLCLDCTTIGFIINTCFPSENLKF